LATVSKPDLDVDTTSEKSARVEDVRQLPFPGSQISVAADQIADEILGLTRGVVSENDEIAFLEVGCQAGELLDALKARTRWQLCGLEARSSAASEAIAKGHEVSETTLEEAPCLAEITKTFDLIYHGHGIERFVEPRVSLRSLALLLNPGGLLILSTPNLDSERLKLFGSGWAHWKPGENRFIYSKKSLKGILGLTGFTLNKLRTVSFPESGVKGMRHRDNGGTAGPSMVEDGDLKNGAKTQVSKRSSQLLRNLRGNGDVMFALCTRFS